jgi:hypothetical protein
MNAVREVAGDFCTKHAQNMCGQYSEFLKLVHKFTIGPPKGHKLQSVVIAVISWPSLFSHHNVLR